VQNESAAEPSASEILLLPSHFFFVRSLALPAGINPDEISSFVEVSLEQISPFTLAQLYYGYYLPAESSRLLVFAAYRKKLDIYQDDAWRDAELVAPDLVSVLGLKHEAPTLVFLQNDLEVTAIYWATAEGVPDRVLSRVLVGPHGELSSETVREQLRRKLGSLPPNLKTVVLAGPAGARFRERHLVFDLRQEGGAEGPSVELAGSFTLGLDIRDKEFLQTTRKAKRQNRWIWNAALAILACFLALGIFEIGLLAGRQVLQNRQQRVAALDPEVERIMQEEALAVRLEELSANRLMPFEVIGFVNQLRPASIYFTRVATTGHRSVEIDALTPNSQDVGRFQNALEQNEGVESFRVRNQLERQGRTSFTLDLTVTVEALRALTAAQPRVAATREAVTPPPGEEPPVTPEEIEP